LTTRRAAATPLPRTDYVRAGDRLRPGTKEYQDLALDSLRRAVDLWKRVGKTHPNELALIEVEPAFGPDLRARAEFKEIVAGDKP